MVQKSTFMDFFEYDNGIAVVDDDNMELAGALYRGIFQSDESIDTANVLLLADWVRNEVWNILTHPKEDFYRGWITWSPALGETEHGALADCGGTAIDNASQRMHASQQRRSMKDSRISYRCFVRCKFAWCVSFD